MNLFSIKRLLIGVIVFASTVSIMAQEHQYVLNRDKSKVSLLIDLKKTKFTVSDILNKKAGHPLLESKLYTLGVNVDTVGVWSTLASKDNIWKLIVNVPQNKGFKIGLDDFYLPQGSRLYVYKEGDLKNAIMYIHSDNPKGGPYSFENLLGDNVVLEYVASSNITEKPRLLLSDIGYKFVDNQSNPLSGFDVASNSCNINVNCPDGDMWKNQKKGVLQLRIKGGGSTYLCSGTLINNTNKDKTPYVLTAQHCFENSTLAEMIQTEFIFDYESVGCVVERPVYKYHRGAEVMVVNPLKGGSDGVLLKLTENIPDNWDVYYNGWDIENNGNNITSGSVIHHPQGDVKKITLYNKPLVSTKWSNNSSYPDNTHWLIDYSLGVTAGGSSGCPIFSQNGLVVGTLTGGESDCPNPYLYDYYGKFSYHWDQSSDPNLRMNKYLDPNNTGVTQLAGLTALGDEKPTQTQDLYAYLDAQREVVKIYAKGKMNSVVISDLFGRNLISQTSGFISPTATEISISSLKSGVYIISVYMDGRSAKSIKIIKE